MTGEGSLWAHVGDITRLIYARGRLQIWTPPTVPFPRVREFVVTTPPNVQMNPTDPGTYVRRAPHSQIVDKFFAE
uniref:Uncharacterized protein n=1 Tax=Magallana gigas TaxID=29159 RepID=K1RXQ2_MAGGI